MDRRELLGVGIAGALLLPPVARPATGGPAASHAGDAAAALAADKVRTHVLIRCREDGGRVFLWYHGTFYGQVSGERTVPLLWIQGVSSSRAERQPDGSWAYRLREAGWFCDLATHEVLEEWRNPLNGRVVHPAHYNSHQETRFAADGVRPLSGALPPGVEYTGYITAPDIQGDDVWTTEELLVRSPPRVPGTPANVQTSLATMHASVADLLHPRDGFAPSLLAYQTLASWRPWMEMGDTTGVISWRLAGRKCARTDTLPPALLERVSREHPDALEA